MIQTRAGTAPVSAGAALATAEADRKAERKAQPARTEKLWWPELDGLRTLAFLLVFYSHTSGLFPKETPGRNPVALFLAHADKQIHAWGWIGVDLFFVLSAFLITSILIRERANTARINLGHFYMRRALRIWPLYFIFLFIVMNAYPWIVSMQEHAGVPLPLAQTSPSSWMPYLFTFFAFVGNYSVVQQGYLVIPLNPLWSLCIEEQFYIVWGIIMWRCKTLRSLATVVGAGLIGTILVRAAIFHTMPGNFLAYYANGPARMDSILMGAAAAMIWGRFGKHLLASPVAQMGLLALSTTLLTSIIAWCPDLEACHPSAIWMMTAVAFSWTCFLLATLSLNPLRRLMSTPFMTHIGRLTYGLYIFHVLVLASLMVMARNYLHLHGRGQGVILCWVFGLAITYVLARISWKFLEKPCCDLKERFSHQAAGARS